MRRRAAGILAAAFLLGGCAVAPRAVFPPAAPPRVRSFPGSVSVIPQPGETYASLANRYLRNPSLDWLVADLNGNAPLVPGTPVIVPLRPHGLVGTGRAGYQTVPVLVYHKLSRSEADRMTVREKDFEQHMRYLNEHGYRAITLDELFSFLEFHDPIHPKSVVITFDDGWRSTYDIAYPILKRFGFPATLFVYTDLISGSRETLSWDQVRELSRNGFDIQAHSKTHRYLDRREEGESFPSYFESVRKELEESARILERQLGRKANYFAYPYGETNPIVVALSREAGYRLAFTVKRGSVPLFAPKYRVGRALIYGTFDLEDFRRNLEHFRPFEGG